MQGISQEVFNLLVDQGFFHTLCEHVICRNGGQCVSHVLTNGQHKAVPEFCYCRPGFYGPNCGYVDPTSPSTNPFTNSPISFLEITLVTIILVILFSGVFFVLGRKTKGAQMKKQLNTLKSITRNSSSLKTHSRQNSRNNADMGFVKNHSRNNSRTDLNVVFPVLQKTASSNNLKVPEDIHFQRFGSV